MRRAALWLLVLVCVGGCSPFVPAQVQWQTPAGEAPFVIRRGLPFVQVTIGEKGPYTFLLDTGSVAVILSKPLADELDLPAMNVRVQKVAPDGQRVPALQVVRVDRMTCGDVAFHQFGAAVLDTSGFHQRGLAFDGILGLSPFRDCLLTLDMKTNRLSVSRGKLDPDAWYTYPWADDAQTPTVPAFFGRADRVPGVIDLVVDTGSNGGIALPREAEAWEFVKRQRGSVSSMTIAGESRSTVYELDAGVRIGPRSIDKPWVQYESGTGRVGMGVLSRLQRITLDQQQRLIRLE